MKAKKRPVSESPQENRNARYVGWALWAGIILYLLLRSVFLPGDKAKEISFLQLQQQILPKKAVSKIVITDNAYAAVYINPAFKNDPYFRDVLKETATEDGPQYRVNIGTVETFERKLESAEQALYHAETIPLFYTRTASWLPELLGTLLPLVLLFIFLYYLSRRTMGLPGGSSIFNFGKSTATLFDRSGQQRVTFKDVAGLEEAQQEVREIVDFLKSPEQFTRLGAKIPKGVILVGPPGTGKTLLAKAVAGEAQVPFFNISGAEFVEMFVGVGAARVRDLFRQAKEKAPCIIFIDEIDAIGRSRSRNTYFTGSNDERESTLNQLLTEMDGFETNSGVIVLAATNRADMLDPALLRPGRFDRHIYLELPNQQEREAIFRIHLRPLKTGHDMAAVLAAQTAGFSGADIANVCNEAALIAARHAHTKVTDADFTEAAERIVAGVEHKSRLISPSEKKIVAYHEAGHAVASWYLPTVDALVKVSIIPRGKSLGAAWYVPEERQLRTLTAFKEQLAATLAGRAAEQVIFNELSSGALDDLEKATRDAYMMVAYYGFDPKVGAVSFYDSTGQQETSLHKPYSEATAKLIDDRVRELLTAADEQAKALLHAHLPTLKALAERLLEKETINEQELQRLMGERQPLPVSPDLQLSQK